MLSYVPHTSKAMPLLCKCLQQFRAVQSIRVLPGSSLQSRLLHTSLKQAFPLSQFGKLNKGLFAAPPACASFHSTSCRDKPVAAIVDDVKKLTEAPKLALALGAAGLLPFMACPYLMLSSGAFCSSLALYQTFYGATMLSYLGGVRWGFTLPSGSPQSPDLKNLGYSVVPQLLGLSSIVAGHYMDCIVVGNVGVMLGLAVTGYVELYMYGYPAWFKGLRSVLTVLAILSMFVTLMCKFTLSECKAKKGKDEVTPVTE